MNLNDVIINIPGIDVSLLTAVMTGRVSGP